MFSNNKMPSAQTVMSTAASVAASAMVIQSVARNLLPHELRACIFRNINDFFKSFSFQITLIIEEFEGLAGNQIYRAVDIYLATKIYSSAKLYRVSMPEKETKIGVSMAYNQEIMDTFDGVKLKWKQITRQVDSTYIAMQGASKVRSEIRFFQLSFHKRHKEKVLNSYLPFILEESKRLAEERKTLKLHTLNHDHMRRYGGKSETWQSINLDHPATFETLAMDAELKMMIMEDLERFVKRKEYYRRVGKAWKRGYLLYGPPGTGKSSLIAAMANHLNFDIYDLELTDMHTNSELRRVLIATGNRSILVVEDVDCSLELKERKVEPQSAAALRPRASQVTLSGLLNFVDGLWSSCGDERIVVFTTNQKDRLDEALLRPGRMDVHIHMSYCCPYGFNTLAANYLGITDHPLICRAKELLYTISVTPAEVGEQLLKNEDPEAALEGLVDFLEAKKVVKAEIQDFDKS